MQITFTQRRLNVIDVKTTYQLHLPPGSIMVNLVLEALSKCIVISKIKETYLTNGMLGTSNNNSIVIEYALTFFPTKYS